MEQQVFEKTAKAIVQLLADNGFTVRESDQVLAMVQYLIQQQKVSKDEEGNENGNASITN